jgi:hypothetical protein
MILICTPYRTDKNIGKAYNDVFSMLGPNDSACITDGDLMFLTPDFGTIIEEYSNLYPGEVLTCKTNRIHNLSKQLDGGIDEVCDLRQLTRKAESRKLVRTITEIKPGEGMSGLLMLIPKTVWVQVPFVEKGALGIDSQFRIDLHKAGKRILIMDGLFVAHLYRLLNGINDKSHLL